jgi:iron complex outermembrane receptor protein
MLFSVALLLLLGVPQNVNAQARAVAGTVTDARTGEPISGAQVSIRDRGFGAISNDDGRFLIVNLPEGRLELRVLYLGYAPQSRIVEVEAGETLVDGRIVLGGLEPGEMIVTHGAFTLKAELTKGAGGHDHVH